MNQRMWLQTNTDARLGDRMSATGEVLDASRVRRLFDLRTNTNALFGGGYEEDPYPAWRALREQAPVHQGIVHELTGFEGPALFHGLPYPDREHFSAFSYAACDGAYRNDKLFASSAEAVDLPAGSSAPSTACCPWAATSIVVTGPSCSRRSCRPRPDGGSETGSRGRWAFSSTASRTRSRRTQRRLLRRHPGPHHHRQLRRSRGPGAGHSGGDEGAGKDRGDHPADRGRPT